MHSSPQFTCSTLLREFTRVGAIFLWVIFGGGNCFVRNYEEEAIFWEGRVQVFSGVIVVEPFIKTWGFQFLNR